MLDPFQVNKPVGMSYALDENDVLKTKNALSKLGHYKPLDSGSTPWPDTPMFEGLKAFQKEQGLKVDGLMKPGGPTEKALRKSTQPLGIMPGEWDWMNKTTKPKSPPRRPLDERPASKPEFPDPLRPLSLSGDPKTSPPQKSGSQPYSPPPRHDETQVAAAPAAALLPWLLGSGAAVATGELMRRKAEEIMRNNGGTLPPLFPAEPEPPTPPSERPDTSIKPNREEFPATPPRAPQKLENPAARPEPTIEIYPGADDFTKRMGAIVEQRRERVETAEQVDYLRDQVLKENKGWEHIYGGRNKSGREVSEYYAPGPGKAIPRPGRNTGDGRKLSGYTDLTIVSPDGKHFKHYQTVDVDRNGKPTRRELDNAERIRRNLRNKDGIIHEIFLVPKSWQSPK